MTGLKHFASISAIALLMSGGVAFAECVDTNTTASVNRPSDSGAAPAPDQAQRFQAPPKDGSTAPLEASPDRQASTSGETTVSPTMPGAEPGSHDRAAADAVQKDGSNIPLQSSDSDQTGANIAMSQQDVEAQQDGEQTMAARGMEECE